MDRFRAYRIDKQDDGITAGFVVRDDVGRIEKFPVSQPAKGALVSVSR